MGMRLLQKKDITSAAAENRKREIDEGHKLANQIDSIRRTKAEEEVSLEKFRSETLKQIQEQLSPLQRQLEDTLKELETARNTRDELLIPLDAEWEEVRKAREEVERQIEQATRASKLAEDESNRTRAELVKAERTNSRLLTLEEVAKDSWNNAILLEREAESMREQAIQTIQQAEVSARASIAHITEEHRKMQMREEALVQNEEQVRKERDELAKERLLLADERETLKRAFNRLKK